MLADLQTVDNRLAKLTRSEARMRSELADAGASPNRPDGSSTTAAPSSAAAAAGEIDPDGLGDLHLTLANPFIYVFNVDEMILSDRRHCAP